MLLRLPDDQICQTISCHFLEQLNTCSNKAPSASLVRIAHHCRPTNSRVMNIDHP